MHEPMDFAQANFALSLLRRDIAGAIVQANERGQSPHMAWHYLPQKYRESNLTRASGYIQLEMVPAYTGIGPWDSMVPDLLKLVKLLRYFDVLPVYGCPECY